MGFFDRLGNAWNIFTTSLSFIKRDKSLLAIPLLLFLSGFLYIALFFIIFLTSPSVYFAAAVFLLFIYFWSTFLSAAQSWMVHEVAQGKDTTLASGFKRASRNLLDILAFAIVALVIRALSNALRQKGTLGRVAGNFIDLVSGIAGKLVLPAMIITERNFGDAVRQLGDALKAIPEITAFEIGIRPLTTLAVFLAIGISLPFLLAGPIAFIVVLLILLIAVGLLSTLINQIYYTLLYLTLIEKKKVHGLTITKPKSYIG